MGRVKKELPGRQQGACPSLRLTKGKRIAKKIVDGAVMRIVVESPKYAESLSYILEATGSVVSLREEMPNKAPEPTPGLVTPRAIECASEMKRRDRNRDAARGAPSPVVAHL